MKIMKKIAESTLSACASVVMVAIFNCMLGHPAPSGSISGPGKCSFENVKLPCARKWFELSPLARREQG